MCDEHAGRGDVPPAEMPRAQAEIVLLAIALGEQVGAKQADGIEAGAPDIHAEAHADRDVDRLAAVHPSRGASRRAVPTASGTGLPPGGSG